MELQECREMLVAERHEPAQRPQQHGNTTLLRPKRLPCKGMPFARPSGRTLLLHCQSRLASTLHLAGSANGITGSQGRPMQTCGTSGYPLSCFS